MNLARIPWLMGPSLCDTKLKGDPMMGVRGERHDPHDDGIGNHDGAHPAVGRRPGLPRCRDRLRPGGYRLLGCGDLRQPCLVLRFDGGDDCIGRFAGGGPCGRCECGEGEEQQEQGSPGGSVHGRKIPRQTNSC
jgi:hypothetical protein